MSASSMISDILPARPARDAHKPRPEGREGAFAQVLSGAREASEAKAVPARREEARSEPSRPRPADRAREPHDKPHDNTPRQAAEAPSAEDRVPSRETARADAPAPDKREAAPEREAPTEPAAAPPAPEANPPAAPAVTSSDTVVLIDAAASLTITQAGKSGVAETVGNAEAGTVVANAQIDPAQITAAQVNGGPVNSGQTSVGQLIADSGQTAGEAAAVVAGVANAVGALHNGTKASTTAAAEAAALAGATAQDASPAKADDAAKAAVRTEATQGFAAQLAAQAVASTTDGAKSSPDGVQALASAPSSAAANGASSSPVTTPQQGLARADAPVPLQALAVEIGMRAMRGAKEFAIRLDPEDMGRVDIRLEISEKGEVQAKVMVERVETLQLLQRDARTLERAFDQAGLKTNPEGLQFSLKDPGQQGQQNNRDTGGESRSGRGGADSMDIDAATPPVSAIYRAPGLGALDIRI